MGSPLEETDKLDGPERLARLGLPGISFMKWNWWAYQSTAASYYDKLAEILTSIQTLNLSCLNTFLHRPAGKPIYIDDIPASHSVQCPKPYGLEAEDSVSGNNVSSMCSKVEAEALMSTTGNLLRLCHSPSLISSAQIHRPEPASSLSSMLVIPVSTRS
jgi:hypothetical protein